MTEWGYIPVDDALGDRPGFRVFIRDASMTRDEGVGFLFRFWCWAKRTSPDGTVPDAATLALVMECDPVDIKAMATGGFLEPDNDGYRVCGWEDGAGKGTVKRRRSRELARERTARSRARAKASRSGNAPVTVGNALSRPVTHTETETETETETDTTPPASEGGAGGGPKRKAKPKPPKRDHKGMGANCIGPNSPVWWPPTTLDEFLDAPFEYKLNRDPAACRDASTQREFFAARFVALDGQHGRDTWQSRLAAAWDFWLTDKRKGRWKGPKGFADSVYGGGPHKPDYGVVVARYERQNGRPIELDKGDEERRRAEREHQKLSAAERERAVLEEHDPDLVAALMAGTRAQIKSKTNEPPAWLDDPPPEPDEVTP